MNLRHKQFQKDILPNHPSQMNRTGFFQFLPDFLLDNLVLNL